MKYCFGYVRVSTIKQGEGVSLDAQKDAISAYAAQNDIIIIKWFEEKRTAARKGRPLFGKMVQQLKRGAATGLVIHKIDRSARNFADWAKIGELSDAGIDVYFAGESLDFSSRGGRLNADILAVISADYVRNLKIEVRKGIDATLKSGLYPGRAPIGYLNPGKGQIKALDPIRAPLVRQLFELYATGEHSIVSLRNEMRRLGLRKPSGKPLSKSGIEKTLRNPFYTGIMYIRATGATYDGTHEPLVSTQMFQHIQNMKLDKCGKKVTRHNHTYRGLFQCGHCQKAMIPEKQKGRVYYRCQTTSCQTKTIREDVIENAIEQVLVRCQLVDEDVEYLVGQLTKWLGPKETQRDLETLPMQLAKIDERLDNLADKLIDNIVDNPTYVAKREKLIMEKQLLKQIEAKSSANSRKTQHVREFLELVKNLYSNFQNASRAEKRQIVQLMTSNRIVLGKSLDIRPQKWLQLVEQSLSVSYCAPSRATSRTRDVSLSGVHPLQQLEEIAQSKEATELCKHFSHNYQRKEFGIEHTNQAMTS